MRKLTRRIFPSPHGALTSYRPCGILGSRGAPWFSRCTNLIMPASRNLCSSKAEEFYSLPGVRRDNQVAGSSITEMDTPLKTTGSSSTPTER